MKVKKLIELLSKLPPNDEIEYRDGEWWCGMGITEITRMNCIEIKDKRLFSVGGYYTELENDEFIDEIKRLKSEGKDFSTTHKRVIK